MAFRLLNGLSSGELAEDLGGNESESQVLAWTTICDVRFSVRSRRARYNALTVSNCGRSSRRFHAERPPRCCSTWSARSMDGLRRSPLKKSIRCPGHRDLGRPTSVVVRRCGSAPPTSLQAVRGSELEVGSRGAETASSVRKSPRFARSEGESRYTMLFGHSQPMTEVRDLIERVSDTDVPC